MKLVRFQDIFLQEELSFSKHFSILCKVNCASFCSAILTSSIDHMYRKSERVAKASQAKCEQGN